MITEVHLQGNRLVIVGKVEEKRESGMKVRLAQALIIIATVAPLFFVKNLILYMFWGYSSRS